MIDQKEELLAIFNVDTDFEEDIEDALNHGRIVSNLAFLLAKELGWADNFCEMIADAGMLHDIGKLKLSDHLYGRSKDVLKIEEMKYVRMHPTLGYQILCEKDIGSEEFRRIIYHHHENYDGSGYPDNIKGDAIPVGARILRICDVYSALVSDRPYRPAYDKNTAMELMIDEVKNFDMKIFLAFMRVIHDDSFTELEEYISKINDEKNYDYNVPADDIR